MKSFTNTIELTSSNIVAEDWLRTNNDTYSNTQNDSKYFHTDTNNSEWVIGPVFRISSIDSKHFITNHRDDNNRKLSN